MTKRKKSKRTSNDQQNITQKTKDWATRTLLKQGINSDGSEGSAIPAPLVAPVVII